MNYKNYVRLKWVGTLMSICLIALPLGGCKNNKSPNDNSNPSEEIANDSTKVAHEIAQNEPERPHSATLLFDASRSMFGYLNSANDSRFIGVISSYLNLPDQVDIRFYGSKEGEAINKDDFMQMLNSRRIEWSNESDIKSMIGALVAHCQSGNDISMLITDGILSGSNRDIVNSPNRSYNIIQREAMSNEISSMLSKTTGLSALIVRYSSKFTGTYSCYNNDGKRLDAKNRPFYIIALGNWESIKYVESELIKLKSENGISTSYQEIVMIGDSQSYSKLKLSHREGISTNTKDKGKFIISSEYRNIRKNNFVSLSADISTLPVYMRTDSYFNDNIELFISHSGQSARLMDKDNYKVESKDENGKHLLVLSVKGSQLVNSQLTFK